MSRCHEHDNERVKAKFRLHVCLVQMNVVWALQATHSKNQLNFKKHTNTSLN